MGDRTARLWDADHPDKPPVVLRGQLPGGFITDWVSFSRDGRRVIAEGLDKAWQPSDGSPRRSSVAQYSWDVDRPDAAPVILHDAPRPSNVGPNDSASGWDGRSALVRYGGRVLTVDRDGAARLRDAGRPGAPAVVFRADEAGPPGVVFLTDPTIRIGPKAIRFASFSPDGRRILTVGSDRRARLWDADQPAAIPIVLRGHQSPIVWMSFSRDGRRLFTVARNTALVWDVDHPDKPPVVVDKGWGLGFTFVSCSPDGRRVLTKRSLVGPNVVRGNESARLLDAEHPDAPPIRVWPRVWHAEFSPDGRWIASTSEQGASLWDANDPDKPPVVLGGSKDDTFSSASFSRDGRRVIAFGKIFLAIWDADHPEKPPTVVRCTGAGGRMGFGWDSPDGRRVLITGWSHVDTGGDGSNPSDRVASYGTPTTPTNRLSFSAGTRSPSAQHRSARMVRASSRHRKTERRGYGTPNTLTQSPTVLRGHEGPIRAASFSPDGQRVITAGRDGTARLWDLDRLDEQPIILRGNGQRIDFFALFSPDGRRVVTDDSGTNPVYGEVRLWLIRVDDLINLAGQTVSRNLTLEEWGRYFPGSPYRPTFDHLPIPK